MHRLFVAAIAASVFVHACGPLEETTNNDPIVIVDDNAPPAQTCMDIMTCIAECPDMGDDTTCIDACYNAGSPAGQQQLYDLLACMDRNQCAEVACTEAQCGNELNTCLSSSTTTGGTVNTGGQVPQGNIPAELVGTWASAGWDDVSDFTFGADGSAMHGQYKESDLGSCAMSVNSVWNTGSVVASGSQLTVTLAEGTTTVAWIGGCGSDYQNPAEGRVLRYEYELNLDADNPGVFLTDLDCTSEYCRMYYSRR